ncbi:MAG: hypothetical protein AB7Q76_22295, partial [Gammaproteobacteria bacterium]
MSVRRSPVDPLRAAAVRLCAAWLVCSALGFLWGEALLARATPLLSFAVSAIAPEFSSHVTLVRTDDTPELLLDARIAQPLRLDATHVIPTGQPVPSRASVAHALVPLVILVTAMAALPLRRSREWAWLAVAALPLGALTLVVTT